MIHHSLFRKTLQSGFAAGFFLAGFVGHAQNPGLVISEFFANPTGTDSCREYVELVATKSINFSTTPYTVILCNNGTATSKGWINGLGLTYAFSITTGTVSKGDVVYVGGSCMLPAGKKLRTINTQSVGGDGGIGSSNASGVMGNGGANADGIAVFDKAVNTIDSTTVPVDAIFYGTGIGTALVGGGSKGYQLPVNDKYTGGKLQSTSYYAGDPVSDVIVTAAGEYNITDNLWGTNRTWTTGSTHTNNASSVKIKENILAAAKYTWKNPATLGTFQGLAIHHGGFSGLHYDRKNQVFYTVTDRGPNLDAENNKHAIAIGGAGNGAKLFPLPAFNPQIISFKAEGDSLRKLSTIPLKKPTGAATSGLTNPAGGGGTGEIALTDTAGTVASKDIWGVDPEGITPGNDSDYWFCEEYGTTVWHTDKNGKVINRYAPFATLQTEDVAIDSIFKYRNPNKGFEGVVFTPNNKIYAFIQNSILFPASDVNLKKNTALHRFTEIDPKTKTTRMFGYEHDRYQSTGAMSTIKNDKRYIGDAVAVNDHEILVLEHGKSTTESYAKVYLIDIATATPLSKTSLAYAGGTKSFEQLLDSTTAAAQGVTCVKKTLMIDLIANGYDNTIEKEEGLTIINDSTIAIANDNDFGVISTNTDGVMSYNNVKSAIYVMVIPNGKKLNLCDNVQITAAGQTICSGDSVLLTTPSAAGITYQWYQNDVAVTNKTIASLYGKTAGAYELHATNNKGCVAVSNTKTIVVNPLPAAPQISQAKNTLTSTAGTTYQWYLNNTKINGATSQTYTITQTGTYKVIISDNNGCKAQSADYNAQFNSVKGLISEDAVTIYPNPFNESLTIRLETKANVLISVSLVSVMGSRVLQVEGASLNSSAGDIIIPTGQLAGGVYMIEVATKEGMLTRKIVKL